jgi:hypothetical protein
MSQHPRVVRPGRTLSSASAVRGHAIRDVALSRREPMFKPPNRAALIEEFLSKSGNSNTFSTI